MTSASVKVLEWLRLESADRLDFAPDIVQVQHRPPAPLPRAMLYLSLSLFTLLLVWAVFGRLDIVAVAPGKLVPQSFIKIVQPAESGIVREILVREGDAVKGGQTLVRMDTSLADADSRTLQADLDRKRLQLRRIDAELSGVPLKRLADDPPDLYEQTEAQYHARRQAYLDAVGAEQATLQKARHDLLSATEIKGKLDKSVPIYREQAESWERLAREGFAGRLMALERQRVYIESEQDLKAQTQAVESLSALIAQSDRRIAQITSSYRQQLQSERGEAEAIYHKLRQDWEKQRHRQDLLALRAPQSGIIKEIATHTPGTVVAPGTILLTLVPHDDPLVAEVWVNNGDAGFVEPQRKVRLKVGGYSFTKYGMLDGVVHYISTDAQEKPDTGIQKAAPETAYRALVNLDKDHLESQGRKLKLVPGMQVSAEIHLGTRSVLEYLLSPVQKVAHEAGRER